ncbi:MAG: adenine phosphoribosyltransferase [Cytophagales bacterium]|nr:MAG: adenine phosphoribosyltransferase [Cytophagales bacterium]
MLEQKIKESIREIKDFPKTGIFFKDITPILKNPVLVNEIADELVKQMSALKLDAIACMESRGFWFGMLMAQRLNIPFIPIRKLGKLPYDTLSYTYELEYGKATMEIHSDALKKGWNVLVHDDLLATGGTACAAAELIKMQGGVVAGFSFVVELSFLSGSERLEKYSSNIQSLVSY